MNREDRKAAARAWKERKRLMGVFAVRCAPTGQVWVGRTPNLDTAQNPLWLTLRFGNHRNRDLQAAWNAHGAEAFSFEVLGELSEAETELPALPLKTMLRAAMEGLGAQAV